MMIRNIVAKMVAAALLAIVSLNLPAAAAPAGIRLDQDQIATMRRINSYLNALSTLQGRFTQLGPQGEFSEGTFFLQRPGKIRFEYTPPNPILVIADGFWVGIEDRDKKYTEKYPLSATPLKLLLDDEIDLINNARIVGFDNGGGDVTVSIASKSGNTPGELKLVFAETSLALKQWVVLDAQGLKTEVSLFDVVRDTRLDPKLFWINDNMIEQTDFSR